MSETYFGETGVDQELYVTGVYSLDRLEVMRNVANTMGITLRRISKPGELYMADSGHVDKVPEDHAYVQIWQTNLTDFWREVNSAAPQE